MNLFLSWGRVFFKKVSFPAKTAVVPVSLLTRCRCRPINQMQTSRQTSLLTRQSNLSGRPGCTCDLIRVSLKLIRKSKATLTSSRVLMTRLKNKQTLRSLITILNNHFSKVLRLLNTLVGPYQQTSSILLYSQKTNTKRLKSSSQTIRHQQRKCWQTVVLFANYIQVPQYKYLYTEYLCCLFKFFFRSRFIHTMYAQYYWDNR